MQIKTAGRHQQMWDIWVNGKRGIVNKCHIKLIGSWMTLQKSNIVQAYVKHVHTKSNTYWNGLGN
ncbi:MAG: hypothetical protein ACJ703_02985 [Nitrososphaera sp.]